MRAYLHDTGKSLFAWDRVWGLRGLEPNQTIISRSSDHLSFLQHRCAVASSYPNPVDVALGQAETFRIFPIAWFSYGAYVLHTDSHTH